MYSDKDLPKCLTYMKSDKTEFVLFHVPFIYAILYTNLKSSWEKNVLEKIIGNN